MLVLYGFLQLKILEYRFLSSLFVCDNETNSLRLSVKGIKRYDSHKLVLVGK